MQYIGEDICAYRSNPDYFGQYSLLVTVKSFDLQAIRRRYLASQSRSRTGSVERRAKATGGLIHLGLSEGRMSGEPKLIGKLKEPRGVDTKSDAIALSSEDKVFVFCENQPEPFRISDPWFSYIHTVRFSPHHPHRILVASSGFDIIFEYDYIRGEKTFEWFAWENGFDIGEDPETGIQHRLTRYPKQAQRLKAMGETVIFINNPSLQALPTAKRAAFINSAEYDLVRADIIYATLFHHGWVIAIDRNSGTYNVVLQEMSKPHGGMFYRNGLLATDTAGGRLIIFNKERQEQRILSFMNLPGKPDELSSIEWLQFSKYQDGIIVVVDSNRNSFVLLDVEQKCRAMVEYPDNWAVQEFTFLDETNESLLGNISNFQNF